MEYFTEVVVSERSSDRITRLFANQALISDEVSASSILPFLVTGKAFCSTSTHALGMLIVNQVHENSLVAVSLVAPPHETSRISRGVNKRSFFIIKIWIKFLNLDILLKSYNRSVIG